MLRHHATFLHLQYKLRKTLAEASDQAVAAIKLASRYTDDIEFSCEDAGRTPIDDLCWIVERAIAAGLQVVVDRCTKIEHARLIA